MSNSTRLYRSRTHRVFGGVAGGLADYFNVDVILMRLLFVIVFFAGGGGVIIYIVLWIITPDSPLITPPPHSQNSSENSHYANNPDISDATIVDDRKKKENNNRTFIVGISLILVGFLFLLNSMMPQLIIINLWPLILIIVGVMLIVNETKLTKTINNNESSKTESHEV